MQPYRTEVSLQDKKEHGARRTPFATHLSPLSGAAKHQFYEIEGWRLEVAEPETLRAGELESWSRRLKLDI